MFVFGRTFGARRVITGLLGAIIIAVAFRGPVTTSSPGRRVTTLSPQRRIHTRPWGLKQQEGNSGIGKYAAIRATLDYTYHGVYSEYRQQLQDRIVDEVLRNTTGIRDSTTGRHCVRPQSPPWCVFTAGAYGAGKSHVMRTLAERGLFPIEGFVVVDPDQIRRQLPEYGFYTKHFPEQAGLLTRKEAGLIAEIAIESGLHLGYNVLVDGSLSNATWYETYIPTLRKNYPNLQIAILHVSAPREVVMKRALVRFTASYS